MLVILIITISTLLQFLASGLALRLVFSSGKFLAWVLISLALFLMGVRRVVSLFSHVDDYLATGAFPADSLLAPEFIALVISAVMVSGVWLISPVLRRQSMVESQLAETENIYRDFIETSADTYFRTTLDGSLHMISGAVETHLGYKPAELVGRKIDHLYVNPTQRKQLLDELARNAGAVRDFEIQMRHKNGAIVLVSANARYLKDEDGKPFGLEGVVRNITETRNVENLNTRLGRIIEDSVNEIYVFDQESLKFRFVNRGARENLGRTMEEMRELTPCDIKPEFTEREFRELIRPLEDFSKEKIEFQTVHARKDGTKYDVFVRLHLASQESPPAFFAVIEDITERLKTETALRQSQKMDAVGQLTAGVAHDFNNLMTVIMGNIEFLEMDADSGRPQADELKNIKRAVEKGAQLTKSLLAFSRKQELQPELLNINDVIEGMRALLKHSMGKNIVIDYQLENGLWPAYLDRNQLESTLLNMYLNARDAMSGSGNLLIKTENVSIEGRKANAIHNLAPGDYVLIGISDTGSGIDSATQSLIFDPFYSTKEFGKGTGLGLSMAIGFVKQSGGEITVESELGSGSTFRIYLPRETERTGTAAVPTKHAHGEFSGKTVMLVEDDPDIRILLVGILGKMGFEVFGMEDGPHAVDHAEKHPDIDLLVTDYRLPAGMNGMDVATALRKNHKTLPVVFISGYADDDIREDIEACREFTFLRKPFAFEQLEDSILSVLDSR